MKITGDLQDARIAEVMQVIHLSSRSGTLRVESDGRRAEIGFLRGQLVHASVTTGLRLGSVLVARGVVSGPELQQALAARSENAPLPLGRSLLDAGVLSGPELRAAVEEQIQEAVFEVVRWRRGAFAFEVEQLLTVEETARYPGELVPELRFDTQELLLEAFRRLNASGVGTPEPPVSTDATKFEVEPWRSAAEEPPGAPQIAAGHSEITVGPLPRIHLVTSDRKLAARLASRMLDTPLQLIELELRHTGTGVPGERSPIVVVDSRPPGGSPGDLVAVRRRHPGAPLVAVVESPEMSTRAYEAGALVAVPPDPEVVAACLSRLASAPADDEPAAEGRGSTAVGRLLRMLADLRSGLFSATMSLSLLNIISESAERALLFVVRGGGLSVIGAFGFAEPSGRPLADLTRGLRIPFAEGRALRTAITEGRLNTVPFDELRLPAELVRRMGCPRFRHGAIVPVLGKERVVAVIYADNGAIEAPLADLDLLEVAAAQVGFAFENELLRRAAKPVPVLVLADREVVS